MSTLVELFDRAVARAPHALAVHGPDGTATYAELDALASALASELHQRGVRPGDRVGLWTEKCVAAVAAMQAILRLGAVYVPLDPLSPRARVATIVADCDMCAVVTTAERSAALRAAPRFPGIVVVDASSLDRTRGNLPAVAPVSVPRTHAPGLGDLAYILYTSGSTGTPKGVCISHRNALAFVSWAAGAIGAAETDRFANHAPFHFDLSVLDLYVAFHACASVHLVPEGTSYAPQRLVDFLVQRAITVLYVVPSALIMMADGSDFLRRTLLLRAIVFAGEPFPVRPLRTLIGAFPSVKYWNFYGPTETNVCTAFEVRDVAADRISPVPIGSAVSGNRVWSVRADGETAAVGEEGELYVDGPTVMLGYWGRAPQGNRPYPTGDLVRRLATGDYEFVGRRDQMVKVRGHRIELGEIEAVLQAHPAVKDAVALVVGDGVTAKILAAFTCHSVEPTLLDLKRHCAERLPRYMIVDDVRVVREIPRTRNGKVDRGALRDGVSFEKEIGPS